MNTYTHLPKPEELSVLKETEEMTLFHPFLLKNVLTETTSPEFDELYYHSLESSLVHLIYKFEKGWITSERQVMYHSDECISTVHFVFGSDGNVDSINVFQRSSNVNNLKEDVQFFNYFTHTYLTGLETVNIFVSAPHVFKGKKGKLD
jgi:hypothetical protein